jgi:hypothetical protein
LDNGLNPKSVKLAQFQPQFKEVKYDFNSIIFQPKIDASQGAGHANLTHGNGAEFAQDPLSLPSGPITSGAEFGQDRLSLSSGPITRLRAKRFKEALNGLIQENGVDSRKTKMGPNNNQGLVHVIKAIDEVN